MANNNEASTSRSNMEVATSQDIIRRYNTLSSLLSSFRHKKLMVLERLIDPNQQLQVSRFKKAELIPAEVLYEYKILETKQKVYQHYSESLVTCTDNNQVQLNFITDEAGHKLLAQDYKTIHMGLCLIGIHGLHRAYCGCKCLITLVDTRFSDIEKAIIGTLEVDLTTNKELVYFTLDFLLPVRDFIHHIKILISTKGYEKFVSDLLITKGLVARISNSASCNFKMQIDDVLKHLSSYGIKALSGRRIPTAKLDGADWRISLPEPQTKVPSALLNVALQK